MYGKVKSKICVISMQIMIYLQINEDCDDIESFIDPLP